MVRTLVGGAVLLFAACGPSTSDDAAAIRSQSSQLQALVEAHASSPAAVSPTTCAAELQTYRNDVTRVLGTLGTRCHAVDACFMGMGHGDEADLADALRALQTELDAHVASACTAADLGAELHRHRDVMVGHCMHLGDRAHTAMGMMSPGGMMPAAGCR
ncbi:MAG: hypothetical protein U0228_14265 [Myxococcaceae bacterium]